jgi:hypothetical protein
VRAGDFRRRLAGTAVALALAAVAGVEGAGATVIGSDLRPAPNPFLGFGCGTTDPCTVQQLRIPGNPNPMAAPHPGRIRKWRVRTAGGDPVEMRLRVVERRAGGRWRFVRSSAPRTVPSLPGVHVFEARLRIERGQRIAVDLPVGDVDGFIAGGEDASANSWFPAPPDGATRAGDRFTGSEFLWNATVRRR